MGVGVGPKTLWAIIGILVVSTLLLRLLWLLDQPRRLTEKHGIEMTQAVLRFEEVSTTMAGQTDPVVIADIAAGAYGEALTQVRCQTCSAVQVATKVAIADLEVLEYTPTSSKVVVRVEWGWYLRSRLTEEILGSCHAQAFTIVYRLEWQDAKWKVVEIIDGERNAIDEAPELRAKYCPHL